MGWVVEPKRFPEGFAWNCPRSEVAGCVAVLDCPNNEGVVVVVVVVVGTAGVAWLPNILDGLLFPNNGLVLPNKPPVAGAEVVVVLPKRPVAGCCCVGVLPLAPAAVPNKFPPAGCLVLVFPNADPAVPPNVPPNRFPPVGCAGAGVGTFPNSDPFAGCCCCCAPRFPNKPPLKGWVVPDEGCCCPFAVPPNKPPGAGCCCCVLVFPNKPLPPLGLEVFPKGPPGVVVESIELDAGPAALKREVPDCGLFCWGLPKGLVPAFDVLVPPNKVVPGWF